MNSMLIGRVFCRLLAVGRLLHWKFWFWLFLRDFHFLDIKDIRNASYRRLEIKEVSEQGGSDPLRSTRRTHLEDYRTTTGEDLRVTRLTCNSGVNFRNRYECWSQWPIQCSQLWSQYFLAWIWISWKFTHHRMSVSNIRVLSLKIQFLLSIRVSRTSTRLSNHFFFSRRLGCLNVAKWVNNFKRVKSDRIVLNALHTYRFFNFNCGY